MSVWLDTAGKSTLAIGICDRCHEKFSLDELHEDPNSPGLRVCTADLDVLDPWRLPARETEDISLPFYRPDEKLTVPGGNPPTPTLYTRDGNFFWNIDGGS